MTKQGEIEEGMEKIARFYEGDCKVCLGELRMFLHKEGVVIKVDLGDLTVIEAIQRDKSRDVAVEPLIGE